MAQCRYTILGVAGNMWCYNADSALRIVINFVVLGGGIIYRFFEEKYSCTFSRYTPQVLRTLVRRIPAYMIKAQQIIIFLRRRGHKSPFLFRIKNYATTIFSKKH